LKSPPCALMLEQNDEWAVSRRYMPVEKLTAICTIPTRRRRSLPSERASPAMKEQVDVSSYTTSRDTTLFVADS